jgi:hypothetical protein
VPPPLAPPELPPVEPVPEPPIEPDEPEPVVVSLPLFFDFDFLDFDDLPLVPLEVEVLVESVELP